jgi:hypothetical protein
METGGGPTGKGGCPRPLQMMDFVRDCPEGHSSLHYVDNHSRRYNGFTCDAQILANRACAFSASSRRRRAFLPREMARTYYRILLPKMPSRVRDFGAYRLPQSTRSS